MQDQTPHYSVKCPQCKSLFDSDELKPGVSCCEGLPSAEACHVALLKEDEPGKLFSDLHEKLDWAPKTSGNAQEKFFGFIIGRNGLVDVKGNSVEVNGKIYRINDMNGNTRKVPFGALSEIPLGRKVINGAENLLRSRFPKEKFTEKLRLQCNINAYLIDQQLVWHRDEPVKGGQATANTFLPGSATLFVLNPDYTFEGGSFIYRTSDSKVLKSDTEVAKYKSENLDKTHPIQSPPVPQGVLTGIFGKVYSHGIHRNDELRIIPPGCAPPDTIMRISLNFRYLRKRAYLDCKGDPRVWS